MAYDLDLLFGPAVEPETVALAKTRAVVACARWPDTFFVRLIECRRKADGTETVVLDLDIEVAQRPMHPILPLERVAVSFTVADADYPAVVSLREDFPAVSHLNYQRRGRPKSLCLYAESYGELRLHWTAHRFVERIRAWLAKTADGTLHPDDQPLEPLLFGAYHTLVVPAALLTGGETDLRPYYVNANGPEDARSVWTVFRLPPDKAPPTNPGHVAMCFVCPPLTHGVMTEQPDRLNELDEFLRRAGFSLVAEVGRRLAEWKNDGVYEALANARPFLVFSLPKRRTDAGEVEHTEHVAFLCICTLREFEDHVNTFGLTQTYTGVIHIPETVHEEADISLMPCAVALQFSPVSAAMYNGIEPEGRRFCLLGAGALGSQVLNNLLRAGFGRWQAIDHDKLMPHNLARHSLGGAFVGWNKARATAAVAQQMMLQPVVTPLNANLLRDAADGSSVAEAVSDASLVVDCTASVPVARRLGARELPARRSLSLFLNPSGDALVLLAEDAERKCRLDWLEMQYYREIINHPSLEAHLRTMGHTRYSNACRSLTSQVSQDAVALFAAVGSHAVRTTATSDEARISIWSVDDSMQVHKHELSAEPFITAGCHGWTICTDSTLLHKVANYRAMRLPNETGGVLLGSFDLQRRIIYVVDTLPSPPDSLEWPTAYIRGAQGLAAAVSKVERLTLSNLEYIGEWHSHPDRCGVGQSELDVTAMFEITEEMAKAGLPAVMLIVGERLHHGFYVGHATETAPRNFPPARQGTV